MAVRSVATTDTLDTFRTTFNSLASTDIGDVATLSTSASSIVGAVNELNSSVAGDLVIQTFGHRYNSDGSNAYTTFTVTVAAFQEYLGRHNLVDKILMNIGLLDHPMTFIYPDIRLELLDEISSLINIFIRNLKL